MAVDIGPKIGIEGEAEYRRQINQIITQSKTLSSEMKVVESSFKAETTAQEQAAKKAEVLSKQVDTQKERVALLADMLEKSKKATGENSTETLKWQQAVNNAQADLNKMETELDQTKKAADGYGNEVEEATKGTQEFDAAALALSKQQLAEFWSKAAQGVQKVADAMVGTAKELDKGYDTIIKKTGATGEQLQELQGIANNIYGSMAVEMEDVGSAVGEVNTRLNLTGDELEEASRLFLQFAHINDVDVSTAVDSVQKALAAFGLEASDTSRILDVMTAAGQSSGVGMNELASAMVKNAGALTELGLTAEQSIMFIGRLEKSGVDSETALSGMSRALKSATKQGKPLNQALEELEDTILNGTDGMDGLNSAYDLFGKSGDKIYNAVKTGSISFKGLADAVEDYGGTVVKTYEATLSPWDKTQVAMNNLKTVGSELAGQALATLVPAIEKVTDIVQKLSDWFQNLSPTAQKVVGIVTALGAGAAILAPKIMTVVQTISMLKSAAATASAMQALAHGTEGATTATKAFNVALLANPIVAVTAGVIAATAALAALAYKLADASAESVAFKENAKAVADAASENASSVQSMADEAAKTVAQMEAQEEVTDGLISTVEKLSKKEHKSAAEMEELRQAVRQLNQVYPELNLQYDEAANSLNMTNEELRQNIQLTQDQAKATAYAKMYNELLEQQIQLQIDQRAIQNQQNAAINENAELVERVANRGMLMNLFYMDELKTVGTLNDGFKSLNSAMGENEQAQASSSAQMEVIREVMEELGFALDPVTGQFEELADSSEQVSDGMDQAGDSIEGVNAAIKESTNRIKYEQEAHNTYAQSVIQAYNEMKDAVIGSIESQISWLDKYEEAQTVGTDTIQKNLEDQIAGVNEWQENIVTLSDMGINQGLLKYLMDMGPKGAGYIRGLVEGGATELAKVNKLWEDAMNVESLATDTGRKVKRVIQGMTYDFESLGYNAGAGFATGLSKAQVIAMQAASAMARSARDTMKNELAIASPSKVFRYLGEMTGEGFALGLEDTMPQLNNVLSPWNDVGMFSGRGVNSIDPDEIYSAVRNGAENAQTKIMIGSKEFGRLLRGMGVVMA